MKSHPARQPKKGGARQAQGMEKRRNLPAKAEKETERRGRETKIRRRPINHTTIVHMTLTLVLNPRGEQGISQGRDMKKAKVSATRITSRRYPKCGMTSSSQAVGANGKRRIQ